MPATISKPRRKRGRPTKAGPSVRISPHFSPSVAELVSRASVLRGVTVTGFVIESARQAAEKALEEDSRWRLDEAESVRLVALLARPPALNTAARRAKSLAADVEIRS